MIKRMTALTVLVVLAATLGCTTYTARMNDAGVCYYDGEYDRAREELDELVDSSSNEDIFLFLLERGKIRLACGMYDSAIVDLQAAEQRFDEIEGTTSIGEAFGTALVSDASREYQPVAHEKILLNTYLMISYLGAGDIEGAYVERNRVIRRLSEYIGQIEAEEDPALEVPFARYVSAVMYENEGKLDDARIEYSRVEDIYPEAVPWAPNSHMTELVVLTEMGRAPVMVSREIRGYFAKSSGQTFGYFNLPGDAGQQVYPVSSSMLGDDSGFGTVFTFAFPEYIPMERLALNAYPVVDGVEAGMAVTLDDFEGTAMEAFRRNLMSILIRSAIRTYLQILLQNELDGDAGRIAAAVSKFFSIVETADTRSWQTLPSEMAVFRMEVEPGSHIVQMRYYDRKGTFMAESEEQEIWVQEGKREITWMPGPP
jgi:tetratricopeptide (TPR) repeat protein